MRSVGHCSNVYPLDQKVITKSVHENRLVAVVRLRQRPLKWRHFQRRQDICGHSWQSGYCQNLVMYIKQPNRVIFALLLHNGGRWASNFKRPTGRGHFLVPMDGRCRSLAACNGLDPLPTIWPCHIGFRLRTLPFCHRLACHPYYCLACFIPSLLQAFSVNPC